MSMSPAISICCTGSDRFQQAQQVARRAARTPDGLRRLLVRELELVDQALDALRLLERIEVLALDVLDQRHRRGGLVGHVLHEHRHFVEAGNACGTHAALAGDDLEALGPDRSHEHRLHHALRLDALGQLVERAFVHARARLVLAGLQLVEAQRVRRVSHRHRDGRLAVVHARAEQGLESEAQPLGFSSSPSADCPLSPAARPSACSSAMPSGQSPSPESPLTWPRCADLVPRAAPVVGHRACTRQAAVRVVAAGHDEARERQAGAHDRSPVEELRRHVVALGVGRRDQQGRGDTPPCRECAAHAATSWQPRLCATSVAGRSCASSTSSRRAIQSPRRGHCQSSCCTRTKPWRACQRLCQWVGPESSQPGSNRTSEDRGGALASVECLSFAVQEKQV
jgi:hypothetical protein